MISSKLQFFNKFSSKAVANSSVPLLPGSPGSSVVSPTVSGPDIIRFKAVKRKGKKYSLSGFGNGGSGGGGNLPPNSSPNGYETFPKNALMTSSASTLKGILCPDDHVNLFTVYGNILTSESNETLSVKYDSSEKETEFKEYPLDEGLLSLLENSARFWYSNTSKKLPSMLSLHAPSRSSTWELARHLAGKIGQSNLILVPFVLFHELFQTCTVASMSLNDSSKKSPFSFSNNSSQLAANTSRSVIQVIQYLFTCAEDMGLHHGGRVTILVDGLEEFLQNRKGCEGVLKEIASWMASLDCSEFKKSIILGGRSINFIDEDSPTLKNEANEEESEPPQDEDTSNNGPTHNNNNSIVSFNNSANNGSKSGSAFQVITDFLLNASVSKPPSGTSTGVATFTNVRLEGPILRLFVNGPKNDKRKLLKYSQKMSEDRKKDIFDGNMFLLRSVARNRWKIELDLGLGGKRYAYPSCNANLWSMLSTSGRGILTKRRLQRDEVNEIFMYTLGKLVNESTKKIEGSQLAEAVENVTSLRHDPTRFSSDDLAHLLAERQITMNSLSKYEKRFINCISTATTQTSFNDISLPNGTVETLRSLTSLPLSHPELFTRGVLKNSLTGVLLFGPPGTGKTMLARAVAQESGAAFLAINMSNIFDMWVGEGEKNVKGMFNLARRLSPSIIFIDEIDALLERRSSISGRSSRLEIVNEFMSQWDGLSSNLNSGVIVMGATNRPFVLDDAVLRRLPRRLMVDLPNSENRLKILKNLLRDNLCEVDLLESLPELADKMEFYSGSDLKNVAISAALKSAMRIASQGGCEDSDLLVLSKRDFEEAVREVPASLSDQMDSLIDLRKWNQTYGETKGRLFNSSALKFGFA